jgi:hypothetical protein
VSLFFKRINHLPVFFHINYRPTFLSSHVEQTLFGIALGGSHHPLAPKARDAPNGHRRVKDDCRPQGNASQFQTDACISKDCDGSEVIQQHCCDYPGRCAALSVETTEPAGDSQRQQRRPGYTSHHQSA